VLVQCGARQLQMVGLQNSKRQSAGGRPFKMAEPEGKPRRVPLSYLEGLLYSNLRLAFKPAWHCHTIVTFAQRGPALNCCCGR